MSIAIVTDSGCDILPDVAKKQGITVVPLHVIFGDESYRDMIDISSDDFYQRMISGPIYPTTSHPSSWDFLAVYNRLIREGTREIISIHLSRETSGSFGSACLAAKEILQKGEKCCFKIIDSRGGGMWQGLLAMLAARLAQQGKGLTEIATEVRKTITHLHFRIILNSLKSAERGGRLGKASVFLKPVNKLMKHMRVNPVLTLKDGKIWPARIVRKAKRVEYLINFVSSFPQAKEIAIEHSMNDEEEVEKLVSGISKIFGDIPLYVTKMGPALGVHAGPDTLIVAVREG